MNDPILVWGNSNVTVAMGNQGFRLWIGTILIDHIEELKIFKNPKTSLHEISLRFPKSLNKETQLAIEENVRTVKGFSWIQIIS